MNKGKHLFVKSSFLFILVSIPMIGIAGCGKEKVQEPVEKQDKVVVEETAEDSETVEETAAVEESREEAITEEKQIEDSTENLSNEEWVKSLNVERPTFWVFNELTGERKALEDGAEYTLVEGDELGITIPSRWLWQGENIRFYNFVEFKYNSSVFDLNYDVIGEKTEIIVTYNNREGQPVTVTVYLSKE